MEKQHGQEGLGSEITRSQACRRSFARQRLRDRESRQCGLQLLPAPTSTLKRQFRGALRLWRAHLPALGDVAYGGEVDRETIPEFMRSTDSLAAEIDRATELYKSI